jgi:hypothetical protein
MQKSDRFKMRCFERWKELKIFNVATKSSSILSEHIPVELVLPISADQKLEQP